MLQHESQEQATTPLAAQIRVTAEELAQAINALEASKDAAASHLAGTVPIGQVVEELKLDATPEEVWAQVQKQRLAVTEKLAAEKAAADKAAAEKEAAEKAAEDAPHEAFHRAAEEARKAALQAVAAAQSAVQAASAQTGGRMYARPQRHRRGRWWAVFAVGMAVYGIANGHLLPSHMIQNPQGAVITSDSQRLTSGTLGKDVEVTGDNDTVVLKGNCPTLTVTGDSNQIRVEGSIGRVIATGDGNTIVYTQGDAPVLSGSGDGNTVAVNAP